MNQAVDSRPVRDTDTWARAALGSLSQVPGVRRACVALAEGGGRGLFFAADDRDNGRRVAWCYVDAYQDVPLNTAVRTGVLVAGSLDDLAAPYGEFVARQDPATAAVAAVPISAAGQVMGGFVLFYGRPEVFDDPRRAALTELADGLGTRLRRVQRGANLPTRSLADEPVPPGARASTHVVAHDAHAAAEARRFLRATFASWGVDEDTVDTAALCLSELVTNAIIHTDTGCEIRVLLDDGVLTTTVRDGGSAALPPVLEERDPLAVHGRGLQVVEALATRWGSELDADGTTVWFVLETDTPHG